jgi:hypothetical protein
MLRLESHSALVWGITGNLGGGKTLSAVRFAVEGMSEGYFVVSNITLDLDKICREYGQHLRGLYKHVDLSVDDPFLFPCGDPRGSGGKRRVLVILDECAEYFDQYSSGKENVKRFMSWLRHSSKRSQDVFFIVQRMEYISKSVRSLVARWVWVDDLAVYRWPYFRIKTPLCSGLIMRNVYDRQMLKVDRVSFAVKKYWGQFYNTAECISVVGGGNEYIYSRPHHGHGWPLWLWFYFLTLGLLLYV